MTLEEAIKRYTDNAEYERTHGNLQGCLDFRQLVELLKELKRWREFGRNNSQLINDCLIQNRIDELYSSEITDVQGMFDVIDKITKRLIEERHKLVEKGEICFGKPYKELADLTDLIDEDENILLSNMYMIDHAYCFLPYQVYKAVEDNLEDFRPYIGKITLKPNVKIRVSAG